MILSKIPKIEIINDDCLNVLKNIPDNSIDCIFTDPPYMISKEIIIARSGNYKYKGKDINEDYGKWDKQWNNKEEYINWCKKWWKECVRILKPYRHLLFFFDIAKLSYAWDWMQENNMACRSPLYWIKTNPVPRARKVDFMKTHEVILWFTKEKVKQDYFNWRIGMGKDYFEAPIVNNSKNEYGRYHPTQKPISLISHYLHYFVKENDIVLDPFMGSGSTGIACIKLGKSYIGIEKENYYFEIAKARIEYVLKNKNLTLPNKEEL